MATVLRPTPDERLAELEAIQRPLTDDESADLRRCLHTIYMRHWRAELTERELNHAARAELRIDSPPANKADAEAVADRMIAARDENWRPPSFDKWQDDARAGSAMLLDAILSAQARAAEAVAA